MYPLAGPEVKGAHLHIRIAYVARTMSMMDPEGQTDNIQHNSWTVLRYCNRKSCRLSLLVHLDEDRALWGVPSLLARGYLRTTHSMMAESQARMFFLPWEGLKKIPFTLVLCDKVCSVTGRSSPPHWQCLQEDPRFHGRKQWKSGECHCVLCIEWLRHSFETLTVIE